MPVARSIHPVLRHLATLAFLVLIFLPLILLGRPAALGYDLLENRLPHDFPKSWSVKYLEHVGSFFSDSHGFRNALVLLGGRVMLSIGINSTHPGVVAGEDGWLFYLDENSDRGRATMKDFRGRQPFTPDHLATIRANLESVGRAFRRCGVPFVVWLVPNKQTVYGEHLTGFKEAKGGKRLDQLVEALRETKELPWIDARPALFAAKDVDHRELYFRTDTHWNGLGAFVAYESLMAGLMPMLGLAWTENAASARYDIKISPFSMGDLSSNMLNAQWRFKDSSVELVPRFAQTAVEVPTDQVIASAGVAIPNLSSSWMNPEGKKAMVLYGDSFANAVIPYFREYFGRGYFISDYIVDGEISGKLRPNLVILQIVERNLASLAEKPRNLDTLCRSQ